MTEDIGTDWRSSIDTDLRRQGEQLVGLKTEVNALSDNFSKFTHAFEASSVRQMELQKTRWPVIFGVVSIILVIIGGFAQAPLRDLARIEGDVLLIQGKRISENDPVQDARIKDLEEEVIAIRANEHETILKDAQITTMVDELWERRNQVLEHMMDGHPRRIEGMLRDQLQGLRDHEEQALRQTERERVIYRELQNGLRERLDLMEDRWAAEHLTVHGGGHD